MKGRTKKLLHQFAFFFVVLLLIVSTGKPYIWGYDAMARFNVLHYYASGEALSKPIDLKYNASLPILASPLYYLGQLTKGDRTGDSLIRHLKSTVAHFNHLLLFWFLIWALGMVKRRFGLSESQAYGTLLFVLLTSTILPSTRDFYSEMLWSFSIFYTVDQLIYAFYPEERSPFHPLKLFIATIGMIWFSTALTPIFVAVVIFFYGVYLKRVAKGCSIIAMGFRRLIHPGVLYPALGTVAGLGIYFMENYWKRGSITDNGYLAEPFVFKPIRFLYILLSPGKGILLFAPALLLIGFYFLSPRFRATLSTAARVLFLAWYLFFAGLVLLYGNWEFWGGAGYWGPRFFLMPSVFASILLSLLFLRRRTLKQPNRLGLYLAMVLSFFSNRVGTTILQRYFDECGSRSFEECHLTWIESPYYIFTKDWSEWKLLLTDFTTQGLVVCLILFAGILYSQKRAESPTTP